MTNNSSLRSVPSVNQSRSNRDGWTIWFTGLSGAGKSTLAHALARHLESQEIDYELIDGDEVRRELCHDLGFSKEDRNENIHRISFVTGLLNRHGVVCIVAAISPYRSARAEARRHSSHFLEVHVDCSLDVLIKRDVKGLYKRALAGEIDHFSGVSDPYEPPLNPDVYVNTGAQSEEECLDAILSKLCKLNWLPRVSVAASA